MSAGRFFAVLASGESIARMFGFAATILLARLLGVHDFGILGLALAVRLYLMVAVESGIDSVGVRLVARDPSFLEHTGSALIVARMIFATGLIVLVALGSLLLLPSPDGVVLVLVSLTLLPMAANVRWGYLGLGWVRGAAGARVLADGAFFILVLLLIHSRTDLLRVPLYQFIGDSVAAMVLAIGIRNRIGALPWKGWWTRARPVLTSARPLALHALLGLVMFNADIIFLRAYHGLPAVGLYAAAYAPISFLLNLGVTYYHSLLPNLSQVHEDAEIAGAMYRHGLRQVLSLGIPVAVGGALLAGPLMFQMFGPEYANGGRVLGILLLSVPLSFVRNVAQAALVALGHHDLVLKASVRGVFLNLVLNGMLIPWWGVSGAAIATLSTELLRSGLVLHYANRQGYRPHLVSILWRPVLAAAVMIGVLLLVPLSFWFAIPVGALAYGLALAPGGGLRTVLSGSSPLRGVDS